MSTNPRVQTGTRVDIASTQVTSNRPKFDKSTHVGSLHTDIDNHADTHCFGKNFRPLHWSNLMCTVSPFLPEYDSTENIEICTAATAWTNENGRTYILDFGQGLWFGDRLDRSLINPNQCRAFGISLCDDPTDPHRALGFHTDEVLIELKMNGTIATMLTHCPSQEELDTCPFIFLSDEDSWDPTKVNFQINSIKQETCDQRSLKIYQIESPTPTAPNIALMPYTVSPYEIAMANVSTTLCQDAFVSDLLDKVNVHQVSNSKPTKTSPATLPDLQVNTFTHERHHKITPEALAQKWNIHLKGVF